MACLVGAADLRGVVMTASRLLLSSSRERYEALGTRKPRAHLGGSAAELAGLGWIVLHEEARGGV